MSVVCACSAGHACAATTATIVATDPPGTAVTLGAHQTFYMRIAFESDTPIRLWTRPYFEGTEVRALGNASVTHVGSGDALGWFELINPDQVDEIRVLASAPDAPQGRIVGRYPLSITSTDQAASTHVTAAWVQPLIHAQEDLARADAQRRAATPESAGDTVLTAGFIALMAALLVGGMTAPIWALLRWQGVWRIAATIPASAMAFVVLRLMIDTTLDSTSHNLWPLEMMPWAAFSVACVALLMLARRLLRTRA